MTLFEQFIARGSFFALLTGVGLVFGGLSSSAWASEAKAVAIESEIVFTPEGFDDNDNAQVVLDGWLPTSCHQLADPEVKIDAENLMIQVAAQATKEGTFCLPRATRFTQVVDLGILPYGDYDIVTNNGQLTEPLLVAEADKAGPDDYQYPKIDKAYADFAPEYRQVTASRWAVVIEGEYLNSCQEIAEIVVTDSGDTVEVQPILRSTEAITCLPVVTPFVTRAPLPDYATQGRYLLHVRGFDGTAANSVFTVQ